MNNTELGDKSIIVNIVINDKNIQSQGQKRSMDDFSVGAKVLIVNNCSKYGSSYKQGDIVEIIANHKHSDQLKFVRTETNGKYSGPNADREIEEPYSLMHVDEGVVINEQ